MGKQKDKEALTEDLINSSGGALLVSTDETLDKRALEYSKEICKKMKEAGTFTTVDRFFLQRIQENYRVYIGILDCIGGRYSEPDRFGGEKPHHLLTELRAVGDRVDTLLKEGGLTPRSRSIAGIGAPSSAVPHGNAHSTDILNIINGG
jgi:phage terminase small subunit